MKKEFQVFLTAIGFYTRFPVPKWTWTNPDGANRRLERASKYLGIIGFLVGALVAGTYALTRLLFEKELAVLFAMGVAVLSTGAFHEDGFIDLCDGFGGAWTVEDKLRIMKDSRVGTYGLLGGLFIHLLKFFAWVSIPEVLIIPGILFVQVLSRLNPLLIMRFLPYVQLDTQSKVKPVAKSIKSFDLVFGILSSGFLWIFTSPIYMLLYGLNFVSSVGSGVLFKKHLGGYTGDCLGASQQIGELSVLVGIMIIWKFLL
jgi:adenosylcobinamide-GDP ribazoletransferase